MALYKTLTSFLGKVGFHSESTEGQAHDIAQHIDEVLLEARTLVQSLMSGPYGQRRAGVGDDFWQYTPYKQGDSVRMIDWKKTAQTGTPFILQKEQQSIQKIAILAPHTQGMDFADAPTGIPGGAGRKNQSKYDAALVLSACLMLIFRRSRHPFTSITLAPSHSSSGASFGTSEHHMMQELHKLHSDFNALDTEEENLNAYIQRIPANTHVFWIGDFWASTALYKDITLSLKDRNCFIYPVQITTKAEHDLPYSGHVEYQDMHAENVHDISESRAIRDEYQKKIEHHVQALTCIFAGLDSTLFTHRTGAPMKVLLEHIVQTISQQSSNVRI